MPSSHPTHSALSASAAAVVEALRKAGGYLSFGVGRAMPKEGKRFGYDADGTCGLYQNAEAESSRLAQITEDFGRRADRDDDRLGRPIVQGSRLALHLSPRGAEGTRTARFFVDKEEVAVFVDIEDDGGDSDWVAGVTLSEQARVSEPPGPRFTNITRRNPLGALRKATTAEHLLGPDPSTDRLELDADSIC